MVTINRLVRSRRKTVSLQIESDGSLTVRAPLRLSRAVIDRMVAEKTAWIEQHRQRLHLINAARPRHAYQPGEQFFYLGTLYSLQIIPRLSPPLALENGVFWLSAGVGSGAEAVFIDWYRRQARLVISAGIDRLAAQHGYVYHGLRITSAGTRWGSCGSQGTLNFPWRLVMAPEAVIEYVILHELVHLEVKNHSRSFWEKVAEKMPDYHDRRDWLKANGLRLSL